MSKLNLDDIAPDDRESCIREMVGLLGASEYHVEGRTPHSLACSVRSLRLAREFAGRFCVNSIDNDGSTALTFAPDAEFTNYLVKLGAKVSDEMPDDGATSLHRAAIGGRTDQLHVLLTKSDGLTCLEKYDEFGRTPLACAAEAGHIGAVTLLLDHGADPNAYDEDYLGYTVLQCAIAKGNVRVAKLLLDKGADPSLREGMTKLPAVLAEEQQIFEELRQYFAAKKVD